MRSEEERKNSIYINTNEIFTGRRNIRISLNRLQKEGWKKEGEKGEKKNQVPG